jgi:hypothetical protein
MTETHEVQRALRLTGIDREHVKELTASVAKLREAGLRPVRVFPKGIPVPDGVWVHTLVKPDELERLASLLRDFELIDELRVFPKGIPRPDLFLAEIGLR